MKMTTFKNMVYTGALMVATGIMYEAYDTIKDAKNYKSISDYQREIKLKDSKRYDSLRNNPIATKPLDFNDWRYEARIMEDSLKLDSLVKKAYFDGAQMVRDSIKNAHSVK